MVTYYTNTETIAEYHKRIREWERQWKYERDIVSSAPPRHISVSAVEPDTIELEDPG